MNSLEYITKNIDKSCFVNKNIFITGGNSGIGFELAKQCASLGSNIFLLCRNQNRAEKAKLELINSYPNTKVTIILLDLADFSSIQEAAKEIAKYDVDYFVNNAGVCRLPKSETKDGFEITMGTNFIGTLYLNDLLMPYFRNLRHDVKVLFESSMSSMLTKIDLNDFFMESNYRPLTIYGRSKVGINSIFFNYLEENKDYKNIIFSLAHPGAAYTPLVDKGFKSKFIHSFGPTFMKLFLNTPDKASLSLLKALSSNENGIKLGPKNFFALSGFPKVWNIKPQSNYKEIVQYGRELIKKVSKQ